MQIMLEAALAYARAGIPVFPCNPDTKQPLIASESKGAGGLKMASTQAARVRQWWMTWPDAMIAMRTGSRGSGGSGIFAIDIDPPAGTSADVMLSKLIEFLAEMRAASASLEGSVVSFAKNLAFELPSCPIVRTPRGGLHLWYLVPDGVDIRNRADILRSRLPGVDARGDDGYVIVPPSIRQGPKSQADQLEGHAYSFEVGVAIDGLAIAGDRNTALQRPPLELVRFVLEKHDQKPRESTRRAVSADAIAPASDAKREAQQRYAANALDAELANVRAANKGHRNHALNIAALSLGKLIPGGFLIEDAVRALLFQAAEASGLVADDGAKAAEDTIESGLRAGMASPRDLSEVGNLAGRSSRPPPIGDDDRPYSPQPPSPRGRQGGSDLARFQVIEGGLGGSGGDDPPPPDRPPGGAGDDPDPIDPEKLAIAMLERQNDSGNANRLRIWFGDDFLNVDTAEQVNSLAGLHTFDGKRWNVLGGARKVQEWAKRVAVIIEDWESNAIPATAEEAATLKEWGTRSAEFQALKKARDAGEAVDDVLYDELKQLGQLAQEARARIGKRRGSRRKFGLQSGNAGRLGAMIAWALPESTIQPDQLDSEALAMNCSNGTLRAIKGEDGAWTFKLEPHDRADKISKLMPVDYDPEAKAPRFVEFIERFQPNQARREFLQMWHGLGLTAITEQAFVLNYGSGANGKTTFIEAIALVQGDYAQTLPAEALVGDQQRRGDQATPELARLAGARMVRCAELPRGQNFRESTLKMLTGGDKIAVRQLHGKFWDLLPVFKAVGFCNERPDISGVDEGIWRRVKLVDWEVTIPPDQRRPIGEVLAEFAEEKSGILNWLLDGLARYLAKGFEVPDEVRAATGAYRADNDPVQSFLDACVYYGETQQERVKGKTISARDMFQAYMAYCHANSVRVFTQKSFAQILTQKGFKRRRSYLVEYLDCELHDVPPDPDANRFGNRGRPSDHVEFNDDRSRAYQAKIEGAVENPPAPGEPDRLPDGG